MAEHPEQGELGRQLLKAIEKHVSADTNYWGEFEELNAESLVTAANACEKIVFSWKPEQFLTEQTMDICIRFAAWMQNEGRTGDWKRNYAYFLKNVYTYQPPAAALANAEPAALPLQANLAE
jgi:hypothetical protein